MNKEDKGKTTTRVVSKKEEESRLAHYLLIQLNDKKYFISLSLVSRIINPLEIFPLPDTLPFIAGVMNYSGEIVPIVDLKKVLKLPDFGQESQKKFILCKTLNVKVGFIVDSVIDSWEIDSKNILTDSSRIQENEFISGELIQKKEVLEFIDILKFISTYKSA